MELKSRLLVESLEMQFQKNITDISIEEIESLEHISLKNFYSDDVCFEELHIFLNVESICLDSFQIDDYIIEKINSLEKLNSIIFDNCTIENINKLLVNRLKKLSFINCALDSYEFIKNANKLIELKIINKNDDEIIDIGYISNSLKMLVLDNCDICNFNKISKLSIECLSLLNTIIDIDEISTIDNISTLKILYIDETYSKLIKNKNVVIKTSINEDLFSD